MTRSSSLVERFWPKVQITPGCWEWQASRLKRGYGYIRFQKRPLLAHRASYEMHHGPIPKGMVVRHRCDNPPCVNPDHLELGTYKQNTQDAINRGRLARGERQGSSILTEQQVLEIRASTASRGELARRYGVSGAHISNIRLGKRWAHLKGENA